MSDATRTVNRAGMAATSLMLWWMILTNPLAYLALLAAVAIVGLAIRLIWG